MKKKGLIRIAFLIPIISIILYACPTPQQYPIEPDIAFKDVTLADSFDLLGNRVKSFKLCFNVVDGDGNIGLKEEDTIGPFHRDSAYFYNLFCQLYEIVDGENVEIDEPAPRNYRIPYVQPQGQNVTLIADIIIDMEFAYTQQQYLEYDSIMLKFYILDREFNQSNTAQTIGIKLSEVGVFPPDTIN